MSRQRTKRTKRRRKPLLNAVYTDECCELHRAGIEDPDPPDLGECQCMCDEMHPEIAACEISAPARRILRIRIEAEEFHLPVCLPCAHATAETYGPGHA